MKMIFRIIAAILLFATALTFTACNSEQPGETDASTPTDEATEATEATEKATKKPKETEPLTKLEDTTGLDLDLKILSQNVRCADDEGGNTVLQRTTRLKGLIDEYKPDIIGTQETTFEWRQYLRTLKEYAVVGSSRNGHTATTGETADSGLGDALDRVTSRLPALCSAHRLTSHRDRFATLATARHFVIILIKVLY